MDIPEPMVEMFSGDITDGIAGTGVKAAFLKCAIDEKGLTTGVERIMRAVAKTSLATGAPITVHTHPASESGLVVQRVVCEEEGVDPAKVVLGHSGDSADADHLSSLAEAGFLLGMDRFGIHLGTTFEQRCDIVVELCRRGFAERMVLSHDAACYIDWIDPNVLAFMPEWHYLHIHDDVLPYLREHGVTDEQIDQMLVGNPRRYFGG
jgi:phosphotriesterase-related protein